MTKRLLRGSRAWGSLPRLVLALVVTGLAYGIVFRYRTDYVGHYLGGFGGALLLLSLVPVLPLARRDGYVVATVVVAIALGLGTESTIFKLAIFDPVDFYNQSLGAAVVGSAVLGDRSGPLTALGLFGFSVAVMIGGFYFAFL